MAGFAQGLLGTVGDPRVQAGWCVPFHPQTDTRQGRLSQRRPALPPRAAADPELNAPSSFSFRGLPGSRFYPAPNSELSYPPPKPDAAGFVDLRSAPGLYHRGYGRHAAPPPPTPLHLLSSLSRNLPQFPSQNLQKSYPNFRDRGEPYGPKDITGLSPTPHFRSR